MPQVFYDEDVLGWAIADRSLRTALIYIFIGNVLVILVDTYYSNITMDNPSAIREGLIPPAFRWWNFNLSKTNVSLVTLLRVVIAYIGMWILWVGWWMLFEDILTEKTPGLYGLYLLAILLVIVTNTYYPMAQMTPWNYAEPPESRLWTDIQPYWKTLSATTWLKEMLRVEAWPFIRCFLSTVATIVVWVGQYNLILNYPPLEGWGVLMWAAGAIVAMLLTRSYVNASWVDDGVSDVEPNAIIGRYAQLLYAGKCFVMIFSNITFNSAFWILFDNFIFPNRWYRNVAYIIVGAGMQISVGTFYIGSGVTPYEDVRFHVPQQKVMGVTAANPGARQPKAFRPPLFVAPPHP